MVLHTEPGSIAVVSKPYSVPLKHHKFVKEELTNLLEVGLIERSLCSYAAPIMITAPQGTNRKFINRDKEVSN